MDHKPPILRLEGVRKSFNRHVVLDGVDLSIWPGQTTVVIGPSGCGKTVLLKHMVGLLRPDAGRVFFRQHDITTMSEKLLIAVRRRIGLLFQGGALFDSMTVERNIMFPLEEHGVAGPDERRRRCREVLSLVGLDGFQNRYPEELSGGQKKRVALARAIALKPDVILYDEPTTGLDPVRADLINELILKLQRTLGTTAVVVTHDMNSARKVADRIVLLHEGRFLVDTTPDRLNDVQDEVFSRFVQGRASRAELAEIEGGAGLLDEARSAGREKDR